MTFRVAALAALGLAVGLSGSEARAQDLAEDTRRFVERLEVSAFAGYTFHRDVSFDANQGLGRPAVNFYDSIGPESQFSIGASVGYDINSNLQVGLLWSRHSGPLEIRGFDAPAALAAGWRGPAGGTAGNGTGGTSVEPFPVLATTNGRSPYAIGDMAVNNYHATVAWNFFNREARLRPFVFGGLGITNYGEVDYQFVDATGATTGVLNRSVGGESSFSTTWGVGVKLAPVQGLGFRVTGRWTPTHLSGGGFTQSAGAPSGATLAGGTNRGWWCDAYWGCFGNDSQIVSQFSLTAGISYRF